jgi:hypothetical protein
VHLGIYLVLAGLYLASGAGHFFSTDHVSVYLTTQSLVEHFDLAIKPIADTAVGADGRSYGVFGIGQSLLSIPLYLVGRLVERLASPDLQAYFSGAALGDWGGTVPIFFVSLFNPLITPLIGVLVYSFGLRLGFSTRKAIGITLMWGLGTAAWVYARDYFQHPWRHCCCCRRSIYFLPIGTIYGPATRWEPAWPWGWHLDPRQSGADRAGDSGLPALPELAGAIGLLTRGPPAGAI